MQGDYVLSSHDLSDTLERICTVISQPKSHRGDARYLFVSIKPTLESAFWDEPTRNFEQLILSLIDHDALNRQDKADVLVDIVICPSYTGGAVDERICSRIGTGVIRPLIESKQTVRPS